jgi:phytanoyl-CoA dioxygenase PhyH
MAMMGWGASLVENGYSHFAGLVPAELIDAARTAILEDLRLRYEPKRESEYSCRTYCPGLRGTPPIMDLLQRSPVRDIVDAALGLDNLTWDTGQIAIRWAHNFDHNAPPDPHLDGFAVPGNGVPPGQLCGHTATIGVFLTTMPHAYAGNLVVWPRSHHLYERYFRERGPQAMTEPFPSIDPGTPVQLTCSAGDVVIMHYELAHTASVNTSNVDRIAVYFRVCAKDLEEHRWQHLCDLWRGWRISTSLPRAT